jgi:hypothetical protein
VDSGFHATEKVMILKTVKLVREGKYAAEVEVDLIEDEGGWSPYYLWPTRQN